MLADLLFSDSDTLTVTAPPASGGQSATQGLWGLLNKIGFDFEPGQAESCEGALLEQLRRGEETARQATWTRAVSVLIANPKGGVGKTPTAILLGGALAAACGGSVCVMEVSDAPGALALRAEGSLSRGMGELVHDLNDITSAGQLAGYTAPQTSFASVIGTVRRRDRLTREDVRAVAGVVDLYFSIRIMDSGNQPSCSAFQGALALIEGLRAAGGRASALANNAIIMRLTDGRPESVQVVARIESVIAGLPMERILTVPLDAHIADRGQITLSALSAPARQTFAAEAAGVVRTLLATVS